MPFKIYSEEVCFDPAVHFDGCVTAAGDTAAIEVMGFDPSGGGVPDIIARDPATDVGAGMLPLIISYKDTLPGCAVTP